MTFAGRIESSVVVPSSVTVSATNSGGGPTSVTLPAATYASMSAMLAAFVAALNATRTPANWSGSISTGSAGTGKVTLNCTGTWSLTWTSTELRDLLGHTGNYAAVSAAQTGSKQCRGIWLPDCPLALDGDPPRAPKADDKRATISPRGRILTRVSNTFYRHRNLRYTHVPRSKAWEGAASTTFASYEYWYNETQVGQGSSWFTPSSKCVIYYDALGSDTLLGIDANSGAGLTGWYLPNAPNPSDLQLRNPNWNAGFVTITLGDIVSDS